MTLLNLSLPKYDYVLFWKFIGPEAMLGKPSINVKILRRLFYSRTPKDKEICLAKIEHFDSIMNRGKNK